MLQATSKGWSRAHAPSELEVPYALHGYLERHQRLQSETVPDDPQVQPSAWHGPQECRFAGKGSMFPDVHMH